MVDLTIFVSNATAPESGLDGTLGMAISPQQSDYDKVSLLKEITDYYGFP